jgi:hypothetical protein
MSLKAIITFVSLVARLLKHWDPARPPRLSFPFSFQGETYRFVGTIEKQAPKE